MSVAYELYDLARPKEWRDNDEDRLDGRRTMFFYVDITSEIEFGNTAGDLFDGDEVGYIEEVELIFDDAYHEYLPLVDNNSSPFPKVTLEATGRSIRTSARKALVCFIETDRRAKRLKRRRPDLWADTPTALWEDRQLMEVARGITLL